MKRRHIAGLAVAVFAAFGIGTLLITHSGAKPGPDRVGVRFLDGSVEDTGSINVVTGVLLDYRVFDTLGEASVIFASVATVGVLISGTGMISHNKGMGIMVRRSVGYLVSLFLLFPVYIVLYGHLSPGGGFQGGVGLSVLVILLIVVFGDRGGFSSPLKPALLHKIEAASALGFLFVGLVGTVHGLHYFTNIDAGFPRGEAGRLVSGGVIPLLNIIIGLKIAAGLGTIFIDMRSVGSGR